MTERRPRSEPRTDGGSERETGPAIEERRADVDRSPGTAPIDASDEAVADLVDGTTRFAFDLYGYLADREAGDLFASPYGISVTLAMAYAGARGETARQMRNALNFFVVDGTDDAVSTDSTDSTDADVSTDSTDDTAAGTDGVLHGAFAALDRTIDQSDEDDGVSEPPGFEDREADSAEGIGEGADADGPVPFRLDVENAVWGAAGYPYRAAYLETLARQYDAGLRVIDFAADPEAARRRINAWVADRTADRITDILPPGSVGPMTQLVLTNAVYFRANWAETFEPEATADHRFTALDGSTGTVPMMRQHESFPYAEVDGTQAVELPYVGGEVSMVVALPPEGEFETFERSLNADRLRALTDALATRPGLVALPRFTVESSFGLTDALSALGMADAFDPESANFDGMVDTESTADPIFLADVAHESVVEVDEAGTEAAAATAVLAGAASEDVEPFELTVDRPFVFVIRHRPTGTVLFLGRVVDGGAAR